MQPTDSPSLREPTNSDAAVHRESLAAFLEFAAGSIGVASRIDRGVIGLEFEHREHLAWPKPYQVTVAVAAPSIAELPRRVLSPTDGSHWLWNLVSLERGAIVGHPVAQPEVVHEFSSRLFDAYQVDEGQTQLAGCHLTEVPFLRVTQLAEDNAAEVEHRFFDAAGQRVPESTIAKLKLDRVATLDPHATSLGRPQIESLLAEAPPMGERFVATTVVLAKRAEGAVQFGIREQCARVTFDDWTTTLTAPPFHCAATGIDTFHLAAIDDGRIVAAEAIALCEHSAARVLGRERVKCAVTGKLVDPRLAAVCPTSGAQLLEGELVACHACQQRVSPAVLAGGVCRACRGLPVVRASDTWVAGLVEQFPALAEYRKFQAGTSGGLRRVMAVGLWRRLLIVTPEDANEPTLVAMRQGMAGGWEEVPKSEWPSRLGWRALPSA